MVFVGLILTARSGHLSRTPSDQLSLYRDSGDAADRVRVPELRLLMRQTNWGREHFSQTDLHGRVRVGSVRHDEGE